MRKCQEEKERWRDREKDDSECKGEKEKWREDEKRVVQGVDGGKGERY